MNSTTTIHDEAMQFKAIMDSIIAIDTNDVNNENANMSAGTPAGQMMTFASTLTKDYTYKHLLHEKYALLHQQGDIHIHDLDYYPTKTTTCVQYDLADLFARGFTTKNGSIRPPQSIQSYATLATIVFQTNQNEQHGGQSIPAFDFFMAPGVLKTFRKYVSESVQFLEKIAEHAVDQTRLAQLCEDYLPSIILSPEERTQFTTALATLAPTGAKHVTTILEDSYTQTEHATYQAMEGFIHNLNTMHSRGGNQVVFSSINYGTDTSPEGRLVISQTLKATVAGLGNGEIPVFPIQIFKVKDGISYSDADYQSALADYTAAQNGEQTFNAPNFDLLLQAVQTSATALFPNFVFLDTPYNKHKKWNSQDPERYRYEVAAMGCRTRVFENLHGEKSSLGRGNLSFTSINFPRLAIIATATALHHLPEATTAERQAYAANLFIKKVGQMATIVAEQLKERYDYQCTALSKQFPFMLQNNVWKGGSHLESTDPVGDILQTGTLGIGFIGGHNAMMALFGEGHGTNEKAHDTLMAALKKMNIVVAAYKEKYNLNYSVLATPAEGLSGRFTKLDQTRFGIIPGVNDRDYYVNSFHIDVKEDISIFNKIQKEAPFHALTPGGHISYVELDGEAKKNPQVLFKIVKAMYDANIGYGSINHPIDTCVDCNFRGVIYDACPTCGGEQISRMRRITGYLTGSLQTWNSAKKAEEKDRVKHGNIN